MEMKLILEIAEDKKLELSEKEAKELFAKLKEMFGYSINTWVYPYVGWNGSCSTGAWYTLNTMDCNSTDGTTTYKVRMY